MSVYRDRDRDRDWDTESYRGDRSGKSYTTVKRYKVPDRDTYEDDNYETDVKITTSRGPERSRSNVREYSYERDVERDRSSRDYRYNRQSDRDHSPSEVREYRVEREVSRDPPRRDNYDVERYTRETEYYREPERSPPTPIVIRTEAPQPIIIRESARPEIVVQEREREREETRSEYQEKRSEYNENRQVARHEPSPQEDDEYYYQRRVRQIRRRSDDEFDDRQSRAGYSQRDQRDQRDSVSQRERDDYSDDEYYYRRTEEYGSRDSSPHHKKHLAEGAVAGLGAAALLRHHRKNKGEDAGGIGRLAGGAALGAVAAEGITRARSHFGRDRSRARSIEREFTSGGRRRSRERSTSPTWFDRVGDRFNDQSNLAKFGEVAAIGALAAYAARKGRAKAEEHRSKSRRRSSRGRGRSSSASGGEGEHHTRNTMVKAGLGSAAVAAVVDRVRSKSRGGRSKSKVREAIPVAAAGLGGAALAGLYERNKHSKKDREHRGRSVSRSDSRSRSVPYPDGQRGAPRGDQNLIEYGDDPIAPDARARGAAEGYYGGRARGSSDSVSPRPRLRSRSRDPGLENVGGGAAAGGVVGAAAIAADERRRRRREEREMRRQEDRQDPGQQGYGFGPYAQAPPESMPGPQQYQQPAQYYPYTNNFAPPPNNPYSPTPNIINSQHPPPPDPNDYPANPSYAPPQPPPAGPEYGYQPPGPHEPYPNDANYRGPHQGNNVSKMAARYLPSASSNHLAGLHFILGFTDTTGFAADVARSAAGSTTSSWSRPSSPNAGAGHENRKSVQFNLQPNEAATANHAGEHVNNEASDVERADGAADRDIANGPSSSEGVSRDDAHPGGPSRNIRDRGIELDTDSEDDRHYDYVRNRDNRRSSDRERETQREVERPRGALSSDESSDDDAHKDQDERQENHRERDKDKKRKKKRRRHTVDGQPSSSRRDRHRSHRERSDDDNSENSDATVTLPDRFDRDGRKKSDNAEDGIAERIDDMLNGRGTASKLFQRFAGPFLGNDGGGSSGQHGRR